MRPLVRRRRCSLVYLLDILFLLVLFVLGCLVLYQYTCRSKNYKQHFLKSADFHSTVRHDYEVVVKTPRSVISSVDSRQCTMGRCFDVHRCTDLSKFRVYVYPDEEDKVASSLYGKILRVIRNSKYYTTNPEEACVFVPSYDTLDRDSHSKDSLKNLPPLRTLEYWNGGRNHLLFNQYIGTWPDYKELLDFDTGQAIIARASFNTSHFRHGFDISLPLMHKEHPEKGGEPGVLNSNGNLFPVKRKYLLVFKGKRYLYGRGRESRSSVRHLHNGKDIIMLTSCKHNRDWLKYQDENCNQDNQLYERYKYSDLLANSSFCLVPRGRRLGSFRFLESLQSSCIPVSLSNGYVLPFSEVLDWSMASLNIDERQLLQVPHIVRNVPTQQLLSMRLHTQFMWDTYFSTVEKVVMTTLEIISNRLRPKHSDLWNHPPGGLVFQDGFSMDPHHYPFYHDHHHTSGANYTAIITVSTPVTRESAPLIKLMRNIATAAHLEQIVVLWVGPGPPKVYLPSLPVRVTVVRREAKGQLNHFWPLEGIHTSAILHLREGVELNSDEAEFGFSTWQSFPDRLVGFIAHKHYWDSLRLQWSYSSQPSNEFSMVLSEALFYHNYYGYLLSESLAPSIHSIADQSSTCLDIVFNFMVAHVTHKSPIKVTNRRALTRTTQESTSTQQKLNQDRIACFNLVANAYGYVPLVTSSVRMDPVLYKDNVSMFRKEYRKLEAT